MPVLVVAGELDRTYVALGERLVSMLPDATLEVVAAAGHGVPFARPDAFVGAVRDWLEPH
jgi:pimeloyl-ACP methyl ester carboxylesterase